MKHNANNSEAVSPVIGVILMVAIVGSVECTPMARTVILAAVIAAFVFGMAGSLQTTKTVAITSERINSTAIALTNHGGKDVSALTSIAITGAGSGTLGTSVGSTTTVIVGAAPARIIVTGTFNDGSQQVLLESNT